MQLGFQKKSKKPQWHIIDGKLEENYYLNPFHAKTNKKALLKILQNKLGFHNFISKSPSQKLIEVKISSENRLFSIDTLDGGGRRDGSMKVEIPFSNRAFQLAIRNDVLVSVLNMFIPLIKVGKNIYEPEYEKIIYVLLNPIQTYAAEGYGLIRNLAQKVASSSRWVKIKDIYKVYNDNKSLFFAPKTSRYSASIWHYGKLIPANLFNIDSFLEYEQMDFNEQIIDWKKQANYLSNKFSNKMTKIYTKSQSEFRAGLLKESHHSCSVVGCGETDSDQLIASHLKPRSVIKKQYEQGKLKEAELQFELSTTANGFLLCRKHDGYLDKGKFKIVNGQIIWSEKFENKELNLTIKQYILEKKDDKFINYHAQNIFET